MLNIGILSHFPLRAGFVSGPRPQQLGRKKDFIQIGAFWILRFFYPLHRDAYYGSVRVPDSQTYKYYAYSDTQHEVS